MPQTTQPDAIRRKDHIPTDVRTPGKDDAANIIDRVIEEGNWPMPLSELAEQTEWSRSHLSNTLRDYYEAVGDEADENAAVHQNGRFGLSIGVPDDVESRRSYIRGYVDGMFQERE
jgi:hypothetical protein